MPKKSNSTFWPEDLAKAGWTPLVNPLLRHWARLGVRMEAFPTLVWMLSWVRNNYSNVSLCQQEIARQQGGRSRNTIATHVSWLEAADLVVRKPDGNFDFTPLVETLLKLEAELATAKSSSESKVSVSAAAPLDALDADVEPRRTPDETESGAKQIDSSTPPLRNRDEERARLKREHPTWNDAEADKEIDLRWNAEDAIARAQRHRQASRAL